MTPNGKIHKRHMSLSFHRVSESIASAIVTYQFIDGMHNPVDELRKHWVHNGIWPTLKPMLFWPGETMECFNDNGLE